MDSTSAGRMAGIVDQLRQNPDVIGGLPGEERGLAEAALGGASAQEIAQEHGISVEAVWAALGGVARLASNTGTARTVEIGGLGSDTDPGIHGGYDDTGFVALDAAPPTPDGTTPAPIADERARGSTQ